MPSISASASDGARPRSVASELRAIWEGHYYDGRSAGRRRVAITIMRAGLSVAVEGGATLWWPYEEVRQTQGATPGEPVRLERGGELPEALVVRDPQFLAALQAIAPEVRSRFGGPRRRSARVALVLGAAVGALATGAILYLWVLPVVAEAVAARIPVSWEEEIGRAAVERGGLGAMRRCDEPAGVKALDRLVATLTSASPPSGYRYRVRVVGHETVNALAAPGGYIVVFNGLLKKTDTPDELAGVLAHEIQHVVQRHGTKMLFRELAAAALVAAATGDATQLATVLGAARVLGQLHFSRQFEESADREGMRMVQAARIDPNGMVRFMKRMDEKDEKMPETLEYLSSHPLTASRVEHLRRLADEARYTPIALLPDDEWRALKAICGSKAAGDAKRQASPEAR
jgi:Zn-dependent protease with chaperone function